MHADEAASTTAVAWNLSVFIMSSQGRAWLISVGVVLGEHSQAIDVWKEEAAVASFSTHWPVECTQTPEESFATSEADSYLEWLF